MTTATSNIKDKMVILGKSKTMTKTRVYKLFKLPCKEQLTSLISKNSLRFQSMLSNGTIMITNNGLTKETNSKILQSPVLAMNTI